MHPAYYLPAYGKPLLQEIASTRHHCCPNMRGCTAGMRHRTARARRRGPGPALTGTALVALGLGKKRQVVKTLRHSGTMTTQLPAPNMSSD